MSIDNASGRGGDDKSPQPFAAHALEYYQLGLSVIPCDKKRPLVSWKKYQSKKPSLATVYRWVDKFPQANIGIVTGKISNITVIDCDDPNLSAEELEKEFGVSNFIVSTPSGGKHLYYRHNGETKKTNFDGRKIDLIGSGCFIIAPNSFNCKKNGHYKLVKGGFDDLTNLSELKSNLIDFEPKNELSSIGRNFAGGSDLQIAEGQRNDYLFCRLKKMARSHRSFESLLERAFEINQFSFSKPLDAEEVISIAKSVWKYKVSGSLIESGEGFVLARIGEVEELSKFSKALPLLLMMRFNHEGVRRDFCIDQVEVSKKFGWNRKSLKKAIDVLLERKFLFRRNNKNKKVRKGSKVKTAPYQYYFGRG